ncbi:MAG: hypothetical protein C4294_16630, partial [Nitrospiraceae bacterium]
MGRAESGVRVYEDLALLVLVVQKKVDEELPMLRPLFITSACLVRKAQNMMILSMGAVGLLAAGYADFALVG